MTTLNDTSSFYKGEDASLFWEMTICQSLGGGTKSASIGLESEATYGECLSRFLKSRVKIKERAKVLEVGGGYGTLMKELFPLLPMPYVTMVDISPKFLSLQREALQDFSNIHFINSDVFDFLASNDQTFDLVISNENIGDFATIDGLTVSRIEEYAGNVEEGLISRAARLVEEYELDLPEDGRQFALNVGALEYVEKLAGRAEAIFLSEHSADLTLPPPWGDFLTPLSDGWPRKIDLLGHDEYSIRFNHLEKVGSAHGYEAQRLSMVEFLKVRSDEGARFVAGAECVGNERAEMLHEFLHHVKEYECLLLKR